MLRPTQRAFLGAYRECGSITAAAKAAHTGRRSHYDWLDEEEYAEAFADATEEACDLLVAEARRRASQGVERAVYYRGEECGRIREYSDNLLMFLIKGARPETYRDNAKVEHVGHDGGPININVEFVKAA